MVEQGIYQRAALMPRRQVDDHASRLVDDDKMAILMQDRERDVFRQIASRGRRRRREADTLAGFNRWLGLVGLPSSQNLASSMRRPSCERE